MSLDQAGVAAAEVDTTGRPIPEVFRWPRTAEDELAGDDVRDRSAIPLRDRPKPLAVSIS